MPLSSRLTLALDAARSAGGVALGYFNHGRFDINTKRDGTPVTAADEHAEQLLRNAVLDAFPDDGILGEEFPETRGRSGYRWIIDPIDGTKSFIHGVPLWGTLVAVEHEGRSVVGVIHMPALNETVYAAAGQGAWHVKGNQSPVAARVSSVDSLSRSVACITAPDLMVKAGMSDRFCAFAARCAAMRGWSDCYGHVLAATGRVEVVLEPAVAPWDIAATVVVMKEAGGRCTDWRGNESAYSPTALVSNGLVHEEALGLLK